MGRTLDEIAYYYLTSVKQLSDDRSADIRLVKSWIRTSRSIWIKNVLNTGGSVPEAFIQDLGVVELEVVDQSVVGLTSGFNILRTELDIPTMIDTKHEPTVVRVGPGMIRSASYKFISYQRVPFIGNGRFNSTAIFSFLRSKRLYIISKSDGILTPGMRKMALRCVLEDPTEASAFALSSGTACYVSDSVTEYPITEYLVGYTKGAIISIDFNILTNSAEDERNNARDDVQLKVPKEVQKQTTDSGEEQ